MRSIGSVVLNFFVVLDPLHMFDFEDPQHHPDHGLGVQFDSYSRNLFCSGIYLVFVANMFFLTTCRPKNNHTYP